MFINMCVKPCTPLFNLSLNNAHGYHVSQKVSGEASSTQWGETKLSMYKVKSFFRRSYGHPCMFEDNMYRHYAHKSKCVSVKASLNLWGETILIMYKVSTLFCVTMINIVCLYTTCTGIMFI